MDKKSISIDEKSLYLDAKASGYLLSFIKPMDGTFSKEALSLFAGYSFLTQDIDGSYLDLSLLSLSSIAAKRVFAYGESRHELPSWGEEKLEGEDELIHKAADVLIGALAYNLGIANSMSPEDCLGPSESMSGTLLEGVRDGFLEVGEDKEKAKQTFSSIYLDSKDKRDNLNRLLGAVEDMVLQVRYQNI